MQRGSDRMGVQRDDEMKAELQGRLKADHPTRAEEWHDPEPGADDDPAVAAGPVPPRGAPGRQEAEDEEFRFQLARHLRRTDFPADRQELERMLLAEHAPDDLLSSVRELPSERSFANVQAVVAALGRRPRS